MGDPDTHGRLPRTLAGMAAGLVDAARAGWIALYTRSLDPADTARADEILAEAAPELRAEQLARKAAALEMKLNPAAVKARREQARRDNQRVDVRREASATRAWPGGSWMSPTCSRRRPTWTPSRPGCVLPGWTAAWTGCGPWR